MEYHLWHSKIVVLFVFFQWKVKKWVGNKVTFTKLMWVYVHCGLIISWTSNIIKLCMVQAVTGIITEIGDMVFSWWTLLCTEVVWYLWQLNTPCLSRMCGARICVVMKRTRASIVVIVTSRINFSEWIIHAEIGIPDEPKLSLHVIIFKTWLCTLNALTMNGVY